MTQLDRLNAVFFAGIKNPCAAASTVALTLNGEQTVDGVACVTGDRVLVKNQSSSIDNGIYVVDTGDWTRDIDFDGPREVVEGTLVKVNGGTQLGFWYVTSTGDNVPGTDAITFGQASSTLAVISAFWQSILGLTTAAASRAVLGAAASGSNTDITSLNGPAIGAATATTPPAADNDTSVATTAWGQGEFVNKNTTRTANTVLAGPTSGGAAAPTFRALVPADLPISTITNALSGDVALNNTGNYFTGPSIAQGTAGTWFASGSVVVEDTAGAARFYAKLWDGTTVIASGYVTIGTASQPMTITLSGYIASPAGNIRISVRDITSTSGQIRFNATGESKDSNLSAIRIA